MAEERTRTLVRRWLAIIGIVSTPILLLAVWLAKAFDAASRIEDAMRYFGEARPLMVWLAAQPLGPLLALVGVYFAVALFLASDIRLPIIGRPVETKSAEAAPKERESQVRSLKECFEKDFGLMKLSNPGVVRSGPNNADSIAVPYTYSINYDFTAGVSFSSIYLPHSEDALTAAKALAVAVKDGSVNGGGEGFKAIFKSASDHEGVGTDQLKFSGRVFLYHENMFNLAELAEIAKVYEDHGLAVVLRGHSYAVTHSLTEPGKATA